MASFEKRTTMSTITPSFGTNNARCLSHLYMLLLCSFSSRHLFSIESFHFDIVCLCWFFAMGVGVMGTWW